MKQRKVIALLTALTMCASLSTAVFADEADPSVITADTSIAAEADSSFDTDADDSTNYDDDTEEDKAEPDETVDTEEKTDANTDTDEENDTYESADADEEADETDAYTDTNEVADESDSIDEDEIAEADDDTDANVDSEETDADDIEKDIQSVTENDDKTDAVDDKNADTDEDTDETADVDDISIEEAIRRVNEITDNKPARNGMEPVGIPITAEQSALIQRVLAYDITGEDDPGTEISVFSETREAIPGGYNWYYDQLTPEAKKDYNLLVDTAEWMFTTDTEFSSECFGYTEFYNSWTVDEFKLLWDVFQTSNPQYFFMDPFYYTYVYETVDDKTYVTTVYMHMYKECYTKSERNRCKEQIDTVSSEWLSKLSGSDYDKVYQLSNMIADKVYYDDNIVAAEDHDVCYDQSIFSVFCMDHTVCKGYAAAFAYMCSLAGIDCITVYSYTYGHAWNRVKINDTWYEHDVTWYDNDTDTYDFNMLTCSSEAMYTHDTENHYTNGIGENSSICSNGIFYHENIYTKGVVSLPECNDDTPLDPENIKLIVGGSNDDTEDIGRDNVMVTWDKNPYAESYYIYFEGDTEDDYYEFTTEETSLIVGPFEHDKKYKVYITGMYDGHTPVYWDYVDEFKLGQIYSPTPKLIPGNGKVNITWDKVPGAESYRIYTVENGKNVFRREVTACGANISGLRNNTEYTFFVKAVKEKKHSPEFIYAKCTPRDFGIKPKLAYTGKGTFTVNWTAYRGADQYRVVCINPDGSVRGTRDTAKLSFKWMGLKEGNRYGFYVLPRVNGAFPLFVRSAAEDKKYITYDIPQGSPVISAYSCGNKKIELVWDKINGAAYYRVYIVYSSGYEESFKSTTNYGTLTGLVNGQQYKIYVKALINGKYTTQKNVITAVPRNYNCTPTLTNKGKGTVEMSWRNVSGATKYCVVCIDNSVKTNNTIVRETTNTSFTWKGRKSKTSYSFYVQPYINGNYVPFDKDMAEDKPYVKTIITQ